MAIVTALADALDRGAIDGRAARAAERVFAAAAARSIARPLRAPRGVRVATIGGATLGGSGKTPLAVACARFVAQSLGPDAAIAGRGGGAIRVALVGHAYGASPGAARVVRAGDDPRVVGDEARACAGELADLAGVEVIVGPTRQAAVDLAASRGARAIVIDGPSQIAPARADLALLAVDASSPWGSGACPPRGNLRAPRAALLAAADAVVRVDDALAPAATSAGGPRLVIDTDGARARDGSRTSCAELRAMRVGLVTSLARPSRLVAFLRARGIAPVVTVHAGDHRDVALHRLTSLRDGEAQPLDAWLVTAKCAAHLPAAFNGRVLALDLVSRVDDALATLLRTRLIP